jgi:hypothetical protein
MLIRNKYHWLLLSSAVFYLALAIYITAFKSDHFMVPLYLFIAALSAILWPSTFTTLSNGLLAKRILFVAWRSIPVGDISKIVPHEKNGKWSYGTVVTVYSRNGEKLTLQPNHPQLFLAALHAQTPQAEYLL